MRDQKLVTAHDDDKKAEPSGKAIRTAHGETLVISIDQPTDGIARITIDRGPVNALDPAAIAELSAAFRMLATDPPATGILLTGTGSAFSAGVDVAAFSALDHSARIELARSITAMMAAMFTIPCPVVALVNGHALGGGLILALGADWRIAVDDQNVKLGLLEARAGVPFPSGPMAIVRHLLPGNLARQWTLSSKTLTPAEMYGHVVVDELCSASQLLEKGLVRVAMLAAQPGFAIVKKQMVDHLLRELEDLATARAEPFWEGLG